MPVTIGHSPDADDAFMFYALTSGRIKTAPYVFEHVLQDIETLNRKALEGRLVLTAISVAAYPDVSDRYAILRSGGSFGDGYGPVVVSRAAMSLPELRGKKVAVPGLKTSAYLALRLCAPEFQAVEVPFDRIIDSVQAGDCDAGLVIHEGQLTYASAGLHLVVDLGKWWKKRTAGLPLPLGINAIRRDIGAETIQAVSRLFSESVSYALAHRSEALSYAMKFSRGLDRANADKFVSWYVNDLTIGMGPRGESAIRRFLEEGQTRGWCKPAVLDFI